MTKHAKISYTKSVIRIIGYFGILLAVPTVAGGFVAGVLVLSEIIGIVEEIGC